MAVRRLNSTTVSDLVPGKFHLTESTNFHGFMKRLCVGDVNRMLGNQNLPEVTVNKDGEEYSMKTESMDRTNELQFKLGEQFEEITSDGRKVMSTMSMIAPNTILHKMLGTEGGKDSSCTREFLGKKMKCVCQVEEVVSTRIYQRI